MTEAVQSKKVEITKDMTIGDLITAYPNMAEILMEEGVHCVGCGAAHFETIEQGLKGHGRTDEDITALVKKMNENIPEVNGNPKELLITEKAAEKVAEFIEKGGHTEAEGLRINVIPGGCSGYQYEFALAKGKEADDHCIEVSNVKFFINEQSHEMLKGATIDYVETLQNSGFKISNPNAQSTCGCGQSFH